MVRGNQEIQERKEGILEENQRLERRLKEA